MKENITIELKSKDAANFDIELVKEWMDDLVHYIVKKQYEKANLIDLLDKKIGHDLFMEMTLEDWLKYRGYLSMKEALNLNSKMLKIFGDLDQVNVAKTSVYLKTEIDFFNKHHLRFALSIADLHSMEKVVEYSVNLHETKHLADLTLLQLLRAFEYSVHIH